MTCDFDVSDAGLLYKHVTIKSYTWIYHEVIKLYMEYLYGDSVSSTFELCPETVPSSDDEIEVVGVKWSPQLSSTPTKGCSAKQIECAIYKKIKSISETSKEEKIKKLTSTSKKRQGTKTPTKQNVRKKLPKKYNSRCIAAQKVERYSFWWHFICKASTPFWQSKRYISCIQIFSNFVTISLVKF